MNYDELTNEQIDQIDEVQPREHSVGNKQIKN